MRFQRYLTSKNARFSLKIHMNLYIYIYSHLFEFWVSLLVACHYVRNATISFDLYFWRLWTFHLEHAPNFAFRIMEHAPECAGIRYATSWISYRKRVHKGSSSSSLFQQAWNITRWGQFIEFIFVEGFLTIFKSSRAF